MEKGVRGTAKDPLIHFLETQVQAASWNGELAKKVRMPSISSYQSRNPRERLVESSVGLYCVHMIIYCLDTQVSSGNESGLPVSQKKELRTNMWGEMKLFPPSVLNFLSMLIDNTIYNYIKNMTFLDINVIKHMQDLYTYN